MDFKQFADKVNRKFLELSTTGTLLKVNASKEQLWETYQMAYPSEHNQIFRERRVHECNTCYSFIKRLGAVVGIKDGQIDTIWNVQGLPEPYQTVSDTMHNFIKSHAVSSIFLSDERIAGKEFNIEESTSGNIKWEHFYADINQSFISQNVAADLSVVSSTVEVFNRALNEFSLESLELVEELLDIVYRGVEFKQTVTNFINAKKAYDKSENKDIFIWTEYKNYPAKIRNTAVGEFIIDINKGTDTTEAVNKFAKMLDPSNYKRISSVATPKQKAECLAQIEAMGLRDSLPRRHATLKDISVNDVLFSNYDAQSVMKDALDILLTETNVVQDAPKNVTEISIEDFLTVLKETKGLKNIDILVENRHTPNFVSLVVPQHPEAPNMLKWDNNASWSYAGEVTDSMKERVKQAGGSVSGEFRFSIQWNEDGSDGQNDLDAHCECPEGHIYYGNKKGRLDVDIQRPGGQVAVENITWDYMRNLREGVHSFYVNDFTNNNKKGFRAQLEIQSELFEYNCDRVRINQKVVDVTIRNGKVHDIKHHINPSSSSKKVWDVDTKVYQKCSTIMLSPNFWNGQTIGNKHYFFMLDGCVNPDPVRGFYNEFLSDELRPHRKTFEMISSSMKCTPTKDQLSGLGFSCTQRNDVYCKVDNRPYKIIF